MARARKKSNLLNDVSEYEIVINTDGSCMGNPGPIGLGGVIYANYPEKQILLTFSERVPFGTNNEAEYLAVIKSLEEFVKLNIKVESILVQSDSQVIIKQINGENPTNHARLAKLKNRVKKIIEEIPCDIRFAWIPRHKNKLADELAGKVIYKSEAEKELISI